ncbi:hypothetical protein H4W33_008030 [Kibdelosporangium phytohabitans]|nr:hypothetical protein [Kibdelosporangium phytohabitans]
MFADSSSCLAKAVIRSCRTRPSALLGVAHRKFVLA